MLQHLVNSHRTSAGGLGDILRCQTRRVLDWLPRPSWQTSTQTRFVVFGDGRTGSTLLSDILNNHPDIHCEGEILHDWALSPHRVVRDRAQHSAAGTYGFKLLTYQLTDVLCLPWARSVMFLDWLQDNGFLLIYLTRENPVEHAVSQLGARIRGFHRRRGDPIKRTKIHIDREQLFWWLEQIDIRRNDNERLLEGRRFLHLQYEADLIDTRRWQTTLDTVCDYLQIPTGTADSDLERINSGSLSDIVDNHDGLREFLRGTRYETFLDASFPSG